MIDYSKELNQEQLAVVYMGDGPCLVLAGAGSGKTRTITYRVAYLLEQGASPDNILLVTFTNKAANEMVRRVRELTGAENNLPWAGTFHSIANKILRQHASVLGYQNNFTILDEDDAEALIKIAVKKNKNEDSDGKKFPSASAIKNIFSFARNAERPLAEVLEIICGWIICPSWNAFVRIMNGPKKKPMPWILMICSLIFFCFCNSRIFNGNTPPNSNIFWWMNIRTPINCRHLSLVCFRPFMAMCSRSATTRKAYILSAPRT